MIVLGLDPGTTKSAIVLWNGQSVTLAREVDNGVLLSLLRSSETLMGAEGLDLPDRPVLVIEKFESMGMVVGMEVMETIYWSGRFDEAYARKPWGVVGRVTRRDVKLHLCGNMRAKDTNVRQALIDRFGGIQAVGTRKSPGPLHSVTGHCWSALAVAVTYFDQANK